MNAFKFVWFFFHLHENVEGLYFHYSLSVCLSVYMCVFNCLLYQTIDAFLTLLEGQDYMSKVTDKEVSAFSKCFLFGVFFFFFLFFTSTKSWRGYIFTSVCLCVCECVGCFLVNKISAERMNRFGRGFR